MYNVPGEFCQQLDELYDDGDASTGTIARALGNGSWNPEIPNIIFVEI